MQSRGSTLPRLAASLGLCMLLLLEKRALAAGRLGENGEVIGAGGVHHHQQHEPTRPLAWRALPKDAQTSSAAARAAAAIAPRSRRLIMTLWVIRILFLSLCTTAGFAVSQVRSEWVNYGWAGAGIGFGFGGLMIAIDEMLKGFSLRAFSATTFGLLLGSVVGLLIDHSGLFEHAQDNQRWLIRLCLFLGFGYIGIVLAMRSNKEDFSLIIPYVRFAPQNKPDNLLLLDTSANVAFMAKADSSTPSASRTLSRMLPTLARVSHFHIFEAFLSRSTPHIDTA